MAEQLPLPKNRNLYLAKQVDQASMNSLTKSILEINENDEYLSKLYAVHDLDYKPRPIKLYIDSYGGAVYQCFGLLGVMEKSNTPVHTIVTGAAMSEITASARRPARDSTFSGALSSRKSSFKNSTPATGSMS